MTPRRLLAPLSLLVVASMLAGCSRSTDADRVVAAPGPPPKWMTDAVRTARAAIPTVPTTSKVGDIPDDPTVSRRLNGLPAKGLVVSTLTSRGLTASQAGCVYDRIADDKELTALALQLLSGNPDATIKNEAFEKAASLASCVPASAGSDLAADPSVTTPVDPATTSAVMALLAQLNPSLLRQMKGTDLQQFVTLIAAKLSPDQVQLLQQIVAAVSLLPGEPGEDIGKRLAKLDVDRIDLDTLRPDQVPLVVMALVSGLNTAQRQQLDKVLRLNLSALKLSIKPDALQPSEVQALVGVLLQALLSAATNQPVTLSPSAQQALSPMMFLNRDNLVAQFAEQGIAPGVTGCIYDSFASLSPEQLAPLSSGAGGAAGAGTIVIRAVRCIAANS
ncbi:MAG: hypothetical protein R2698_11285 [Microthrixaceae bacterium]